MSEQRQDQRRGRDHSGDRPGRQPSGQPQSAREQHEGESDLLAAALAQMDVPVLVVDARSRPVLVNGAWREVHGLPESGGVSWEQLRGSRRVLAGDGVTELAEEDLPSRRALAGEGGRFELVIDAGCTPRRWMCTAQRVSDDHGRVLGAVVAGHDITASHARVRTLGRHARQLTALAAASRAVLREQDARATVCRAVGSVCEAVVVSLLEPDQHGDLVVTASTADQMLGLRMPVAAPSRVSGVYLSGTLVVCPDMMVDAQVDHEMVRRVAELMGHEIGAGIWLPVPGHGTCHAVLAIGLPSGAPTPHEHVPVLEILAAEVAIAIERQDLLARLQVQAGTDQLTKTGNRRRWDTEATRRLAAHHPQTPDADAPGHSARLDPTGVDPTDVAADPSQAGRSTGPNVSRDLDRVSVVMLDVDHFKNYNDAYGHPAGDELLREMTAAWAARLRPDDLLCRYGGEEFVVMLPGCDQSAALSVTEDLRRLVPRGQSVSAGVATWDGHETLHDLVARADHALYKAKQQGRNQTQTAVRAAIG